MDNISVNFLTMEWLMMGGVEQRWRILRASFLGPMVMLGLYITMVMSTMVLMEWIFISVVLIIYMKLVRKKSVERYKWKALAMDEDAESEDFPKILVQIPLYNEREVYKNCIDAVCKLAWPLDRLLIQVLDDSSDTLIKDMIKEECVRWAKQGIKIIYQSRETRRGFKGGALKDGMECEYAKDCEYVAIFDSDFQPSPDFLVRAIPYLIHNPHIALLQARHTFVNADDCLLTRLQEMTLNYHFMAEQEVGSSTFAFFSFNGTGGIWRIAAINEAGGWNDQNIVEDMDLSVRVGLNGWKSFYIGTIQYRWAAGPNDLLRQIGIDIVKNKDVSFWKKVYMLYNFFLVRKTIGHTCIFLTYNVVLPLTVLIPELNIQVGATVYISFIIVIINVLYTTPRSLHLAVIWVFFECGMSVNQSKAVIAGLLGAKSAKEWVVTAKLKHSLNKKPHNKLTSPPDSWFKVLRDRILVAELGFAMFVFMCGCYDVVCRKDYYYSVYLFLQAITLTLMGFGFIGQTVPNY